MLAEPADQKAAKCRMSASDTECLSASRTRLNRKPLVISNIEEESVHRVRPQPDIRDQRHPAEPNERQVRQVTVA